MRARTSPALRRSCRSSKWRTILLFALAAAGLLVAAPASAVDPSRANAEGISLFKEGRLEEAVARFEEALGDDPGNASVRGNLGLCLNNLAVAKSNAGEAREACFYFEKMKDLDLKSGAYLISYGNLLAKLGEDERAIGLLAEALDRELTDAERRDGLASLGGAYYKNQQFEEAVGTLARLKAEDPAVPNLHLMLATAYYKLGRLADCVETLNEGIARGGAQAAPMKALLEKCERERKVEGDFATESGSRFLIQFDGERADALVPAVREALEEAYRELGNRFNYYPEGQLPVIIYSGEQFRQVSTGPRWVAALYDGKMRIPIGDATASRERLAAVVRHEFTHTVLYRIASGKCPTWLNEGLAQILEGRDEAEALPTVRRAIATGTLPKLATFDGTFMNLGDDAAALAYDLSLLVTRRIVDRQGFATLRDLFERMRLEDKTGRAILEDGLYQTYDELLGGLVDSLK